jgi:DNA-binding NarL/FixJ family response regulator
MTPARILIADSQMLLMDAVSKLLEPEFRVVGMVTDGRDLLRAAHDTQPDMVVLDVSLSGLGGLQAGQSLKKDLPRIKLVYLTSIEDGDIVDKALRIGASAYVLKSCAASSLLQAIRGAWLRPSLSPTLVTGSGTFADSRLSCQAGRKAPAQLTLRQREVLQLLATGSSMKEVAFALQIKTRTVAYHKYRMMEDLNLRSNAALVRFAVRENVA